MRIGKTSRGWFHGLEIKWHKKWKPYNGITAACGNGVSMEFRKHMTTHILCGGCKCYCHAT